MGCAAGPVPEGAGLFLRGGPGRQEAAPWPTITPMLAIPKA